MARIQYLKAVLRIRFILIRIRIRPKIEKNITIFFSDHPKNDLLNKNIENINSKKNLITIFYMYLRWKND